MNNSQFWISRQRSFRGQTVSHLLRLLLIVWLFLGGLFTSGGSVATAAPPARFGPQRALFPLSIRDSVRESAALPLVSGAKSLNNRDMPLGALDTDRNQSELTGRGIEMAGGSALSMVGYEPTVNYSISGVVYDDKNRNGLLDGGEPKLPNIDVMLYSGACNVTNLTPLQGQTTNSSGAYIFASLTAAPYCVRVNEITLPPNYGTTANGNSRDVDFSLNPSAAVVNLGFAAIFADDRLTIGTYAPCVNYTWLESLALAFGASVLTADTAACIFTLHATPANLASLRPALVNEPRVRYHHPDVMNYAVYAPNDPDYNNPSVVYGPQQINAPAAWDITLGNPNIILAVIDTGITPTHPEFAGRLLPGYDFVNDDADPFDDNGHGTHVAGIAAAGINNSLGMAGMAGQVKILPIKVLNANNVGWMSDVAAGITFAVDHGAHVINLSLITTGESLAVRDAIDYALSNGVVVMAAAGNFNSSQIHYPASYESVVAVGALDYNVARWSLSNFGPNLDVMAPGALVWSTQPGNTYGFMSGTSMAAPHVAGVAALMLSVNPNLTPAEIKQVLQDTAIDMGAPGHDNMFGYGRINAGAAVGGISPAIVIPPTTSMEAELVVDLNSNGLLDPGDTLGYTIITANNAANPLANAIVGSVLPAHTTYVPDSTKLNGIPVLDQGGAFPLGGGGLNIGNVPANSSSRVTFRGVVGTPPQGIYAIYASATVQTAFDTHLVATESEIAGTLLRMSVNTAEIRSGDILTYSIITDYRGDAPLQNVVISTTIPPGTTYVQGTINAGGTRNGSVVSWNLGSVAPGVAGFANPGAGNPQLGTRLSAAPTLLTSGGLITVSQRLTASQNVAGVVPDRPTVLGTSGVSATLLSGPSPASATVGVGGVTFQWVYAVTAGTGNIGQLRFSGGARVGATSWPSAQSNSLIVHPPLTFSTKVNTPPGVTELETAAYITDSTNLLSSHTSGMPTTRLPASVGDRVWNDIDGDAIQDPGEPGISGVSVQLIGSGGTTLTAITNGDGGYDFPNLAAGTYTVTVNTATVPPDFKFITTLDVVVVALDNGQAYRAADFGFKIPASSIGDTIWYDADADGLQDVGEPGLGNISLDVYLDDGDGIFEPVLGLGSDTYVDSTISNAAGAFRLEVPAEGGYFVDVTDNRGLLTGLAHTVGAQSVVDPSPLIFVPAGKYVQAADFGYVRLPAAGRAILGDLVWVDENDDGQHQMEEPVVIDTQICATPSGGGPGICTRSDVNGRYLLELPAGDYTVAPTSPPLGLAVSTPSPLAVTLTAGGQYLNVDFGYGPNGTTFGTISGQLWHDLPVNDEVDGFYNPAEPGLPNVSVDMIIDVNVDGEWDSGDVYVAALSDLEGEFHFKGLLPGAYLVRVSDTLGVLRRFAPTKTAVVGSTPTDNVNKAQPFAIDLGAGENNNLADFGYREYEALGSTTSLQPGIIGDQIWFDVNGNSVYEPAAGDMPIPGVTVEARKGGVVVATATTGGDGKYLLLDLALGDSYEVRVTDLFGVLASYQPIAPGTAGLDSHNQAQPYTIGLNSATTNATADFGYRPTGTQFSLTQQLLTPGPVRAGETIVFNIRITNTGSTVIADLPMVNSFDSEFLAYLSASIAPDNRPARGPLHQVVWNDLTGPTGELAPGQSIEVLVTFNGIGDTSFEPGAVAVNTVTVSDVIADADGAGGTAPRFLTLLPDRVVQASVAIVVPTAVESISGHVQATVAGVELHWQTQNETDIVGFHVVRQGPDGTRVLNSDLLLAHASGQLAGSQYNSIDSDVESGISYAYLLQVVYMDRAPTEFALDSVTAQWHLFLSQINR